MRETPQAAAAYHEYAALGPDRSLRALAEKLRQDGGKVTARLRTLEQWSSTHHWQERVKLYDAARIEEARREREAKRNAEIEKMNERHALIGTTQQARAIEQITRLAREEAFGSQAAVMLLKLAIDVERTARGEPTVVERHEQTGAQGGAIQHEHDVSFLDADDPETAALARALIQRASSNASSASTNSARRSRRADGGVADSGGAGASGE